jgi:hypothetical protein
MSAKLFSGSFAAAVLGCGLTLVAQAPAQQPPSPMGSQKSEAQTKTVTIAGCVQKESSVIKRSAMATPMGMGDEYVLTQAMLSDSGMAKSPTGAAPAPSASAPTGTSGAQDKFGKVYRVTGDKEDDLKTYVGQRVEIVGSFKRAEDATKELGATGTSGRTMGEPTPENTPEITIDSVRPTSGSCSPMDNK